MPARPETPSARAVMRRASVMVVLALLVAATVLVVVRSGFVTGIPRVRSQITLPEVSRTHLIRTGARLHLVGQTNPFHGFMVDHYADGTLRSRSAISNGVLHGLSEGWYTNGQLQVTESFKEGVSHGLRTKWSATGVKISEAYIVEGKLHGPFRKWHENGVLSEQVEFVNSQPDGVSLAYFSSGSLRTRVVLQAGRVVEKKFWKDGEFKE